MLTSETSVEGIIAHQQRVGANTIQLADAVPTGTYARLREAMPAIKLVQVIHVVGEQSLTEALAAVAEGADTLLLDSGNPSLAVKELGGTGRVHNWLISRQIVEQSTVPVFLAGGLKPDNALEAIELVAWTFAVVFGRTKIWTKRSCGRFLRWYEDEFSPTLHPIPLFRLGADEINIEHGVGAGHVFANEGAERVAIRYVLGGKGNSFYTLMIANVQGAGVMKVLRDNRDLVLIKHLFAAHHRVEGAKASIIQRHHILRNAKFEQSLLHIHRLVVVLRVVVATEDDVLDFALFPKPCCGFHPVPEKQIFFPAPHKLAGAEHQSYIVGRQLTNIKEDLITGACNHPPVAE